MRKFDFLVLSRDNETVRVNRSVELPNSAAAWPIITALAHSLEEPGGSILVRNEAGDAVIRTGIACARSLSKMTMPHNHVAGREIVDKHFSTSNIGL